MVVYENISIDWEKVRFSFAEKYCVWCSYLVFFVAGLWAFAVDTDQTRNISQTHYLQEGLG
jgi:hypothetical protein